MAAANPSFADICSQMSNRKCAPIYILQGDEGYYVDQLVDRAQAMVPDHERDFNLYVLYATQSTPAQVAEACLRYPMMAERTVVILKEAQSVKADFFTKLEGYAAHPNPSCVLVIAARGGSVTGAKFLKAAKASGAVTYSSPKMFDSQVPAAIDRLCKERNITIDTKARAMLADFVGPNLTTLVNEIDKLKMALPAGAAITPQAVERLIGISKDYNNWELLDAISRRDNAKAYKIAEYFRSNPKANPSIMTNVALFGLFSKTLIAHYAPPPKSETQIAAAIGTRPGGADMKRIMTCMANFSPRQTVNAIAACRRFDVRSKGIGSRTNEYDLLRELLFTLLT